MNTLPAAISDHLYGRMAAVSCITSGVAYFSLDPYFLPSVVYVHHVSRVWQRFDIGFFDVHVFCECAA